MIVYSFKYVHTCLIDVASNDNYASKVFEMLLNCDSINLYFRYISGKRPDYARRYSESESEEEEQDFVNK